MRWYLGYDLTGPLPDHSSPTRIRDRFGLDIFRRFFDAVVARCVAAGLVWGAELYFDATRAAANAAPASVQPRFAVEAHLAALFAVDSQEDGEEEASGEMPGVRVVPAALSVEEHHALTAENMQRHDWLAREDRQQRDVFHGNYRRIADFKVSATDPDADARENESASRLSYPLCRGRGQSPHQARKGDRFGAVSTRAILIGYGVIETTQKALGLAFSTSLEDYLDGARQVMDEELQ